MLLDLVADTPLPPGAEPARLLNATERGRNELRSLATWADTKGMQAAQARELPGRSRTSLPPERRMVK